MKHITTHSITFLIALLCITFLSITSLAQNTSPLKVVEFRMIPGGIMDELRLEKNERTDYDDNPVCEIKVKAQGFDEEVMQRFKFSANGPWITKVEFDDSKNEWRIYLSSKRRGSLKIKYQGDCVFDFPSALEPKKIYELTLGMETATLNIITTPEDAAIYIDDEKVGVGYGSKAVSIGAEHRYKVECEDYITEESSVTFTQSEKKELNIELRPDFGYITVKSTPGGAEVYIDKKKAGVTPYLMEKIKRGQHVVELRMTGYEPFADMVTIKAGEVNRQLENVTLEAVRVATGTIVLESDPAGAVITIDGRQYGQTPKTLTEFPAGTYTVYFTKEGYQNLAQNLDLKDGGRETLSVTLTNGREISVSTDRNGDEIYADVQALCEEPLYADFLHLPHGINGYFDYQQALACSKAQNKPIFVDFTGHGCVNCREMESSVWADKEVLKILKHDYVVVALYVDDKKTLPEEYWVTGANGKVKKTLGAINADFQVSKFEANAQPYYCLMGNNGELLVAPRSYNLDVEAFRQFLLKGVENFKNGEFVRNINE